MSFSKDAEEAVAGSSGSGGSSGSSSSRIAEGAQQLAAGAAKKLAMKAFGGIHGLSDEYIVGQQRRGEAVERSKRVTLAAVVSGLSEMGIERLTGKPVNEYIDSQAVETSNTPLPPGQARPHFSDNLMDKVVSKISAAEERQKLQKRLHDTRRSEQPKLSLTQLSQNFRALSFKMGSFFDLERYVVSVVCWDNPWKTLTFLLLYTWACIKPYLFLVYPLFVVCFLVIVPSYIEKHPLGRPQIVPGTSKPVSLFGFLHVTEEEAEYCKEDEMSDADREAAFEQRLKEQGFYGESMTPSSSESTATLAPKSSSSTVATDPDSILDAKTKELIDGIDSADDSPGGAESSTGITERISVLISMRNLQNLTTNVVKTWDSLEEAVKDTCSFRDEKTSTILFFQMFGLMAITCALGNYIPWKAIFVLGGWVGMLVGHPKRGQFLAQFKRKPKPNSFDHMLPKKSPVADLLMINPNDIVVDEPSVYRKVAVFQIEEQDVVQLDMYHSFMFSSSCYTESSTRRSQKKKPFGTTVLRQVRPPSEKWQFVPNNSWEIDGDTYAWCEAMDLGGEVYVNDDDGWAYDLNGEYRRRRLLREVCRTGL